MIRALAVAEGGRSKMRAADIRAQAFGPGAHFRVLVADGGADRGLVGYALFFHFYDTDDGVPGFFLADLFVVEAARGGGAGRALMAGLAALAKSEGRLFVVWTVRHENGRALSFYRRLGANANGHLIHFVEGPAFDRLARAAGPVRSRG